MDIKYIKDYYEQVYERFPEVSPQDIRRILNYGWKSLYLHNSYGGDTVLSQGKFWCYIGYITKNSLKHFSYYIKKLALKFRVLYKKYRIQDNGYYYFGLNDKAYEEQYGSLIKKKGRKKKKFTFKNIVLYKIYDECIIKNYGATHFFRVPFPDFVGYTRYKEEFNTDAVELIMVRPVPKFKDVLVTNYDYELL